MSERKAINKYYPPDYNPLEAEKAARKLSKKLKTMKKDVVTIRLMTPFGMRCQKCSEYISKSRKFNGKKEQLPEKYLDSIKIFRLSIRCPRCNNMITFRTDPKSADYLMESGGERNYIKKHDNENSNKEETVDEALERLTKEQQREQEELAGTATNGDDKMEVLEKQLAKLQQQQEDDDELENIKRMRYAALKREEQLKIQMDEQLNPAISEFDDDLSKQVEDAFKRFEDSKSSVVMTNSNKNDTDTVSNSIPTKIPDISMMVSKPKSMKKRLKVKKINPLGVVTRRK